MSLRVALIPAIIITIMLIVVEIPRLHQLTTTDHPQPTCHIATLKNKSKLLFAHFPKTGGTTFVEEILRKHVGVPNLCTNPYEYCIDHTVIGRMRYLNYNLTHWLLSNVFSMTMLRHPIDRLLSEYYYNKSPVSRGKLLANNQTLDEFLNQTRLTYHQTSYIGTFGQGDLATALMVLEHFDIVSTTEQFDEFVTAFAMYFDINPSAVTYQKYRVMLDRPSFETLTPHQQQVIKILTANDTVVYSYAKTLFARRFYTNTNFEHCLEQQQIAQSQVSDDCDASDLATNYGQMNKCYKTVKK